MLTVSSSSLSYLPNALSAAIWRTIDWKPTLTEGSAIRSFSVKSWRHFEVFCENASQPSQEVVTLDIRGAAQLHADRRRRFDVGARLVTASSASRLTAYSS
jgi:hypothetical protein